MKAYKLKKYACILVSGIIIMSFFSGCAKRVDPDSQAVYSDAGMKTEGLETEAEEKEVAKPSQETGEGALLPDDTTEASSSHYEDDILSFDLPGDTYYQISEAMGKNTAYVMCYAMPDDDYKAIIREGIAQLGGDESQIEASSNIPYEFIEIKPDSKCYLESFYDEEISSASAAADCSYNDYVKTGYNESSTEDIGCVGRTTTTIDNQTAYVIWHRGSDDSILLNATHYEFYVDSPKGTIVEVYYYYQGEGFRNLQDEVFSSIKFKY